MGRQPDPAIAGARTPMDAIAAADRRATILDDREYIEDVAVYHWLRAHQLAGRGHNHLVMGSRLHAPLPPTWPHKVFLQLREAEGFLLSLSRDRATLTALRRLGRELQPQAQGESGPDLAKAMAPALLSGELWATEVARPPARDFVSKTSPSAFARIGGPYNIDYAYIAQLEGDQWLRGYVPMNAQGTIGRSGMTVASGFDVGQWSPRELDDLGFPKALVDKLKPFAGVPLAHVKAGQKTIPMTRAEVVATVARLGPVPVLTKDEADLCDEKVFGRILKDAASAWDRQRSRGVPGFSSLPGGWQTVWLSRNYQEGPAPGSAAAKTFRRHAVAGEWKEAVAALRAYTEYGGRMAQEALKLEAAMPPDPVKPAAVGAAGAAATAKPAMPRPAPPRP